MESLVEFYKNKKVFITGATGFKGSYLAYILNLFGANVYGCGLEPEKNPSDLFEILSLNNKIKNLIFDIRKKDNFEILKEIKPDIVFHLAAQPFVRYSYKNPLETYETNVIGTLNLFETIRQKSIDVKAIVNITTDKVYENIERENYFYKEEDKFGGYDPYSSSKACVEILSSSYRRSFFDQMDINLTTVRAGNVIGGGDFGQDRLIPDLVRLMYQKKPQFEIRNPNAIRPWQHVLDVCCGYLKLGEKVYSDKKFAKSYNISSQDKSFTVKELLVDFLNYFDQKIEVKVEESNFHEAQLLQLDSSLIEKEIGFTNQFNNKQAIQKTAEWYKNFLENSNMEEFTNKQIKEYFKL